jgi:hypothetical protein
MSEIAIYRQLAFLAIKTGRPWKELTLTRMRQLRLFENCRPKPQRLGRHLLPSASWGNDTIHAQVFNQLAIGVPSVNTILDGNP